MVRRPTIPRRGPEAKQWPPRANGRPFSTRSPRNKLRRHAIRNSAKAAALAIYHKIQIAIS